MNEYTICSRCNEKPATICLSCLTDCTLKQQPSAGKFRQKVTCALLDSRSTEEQCEVALKLLHEAEDIIDTSEARRKVIPELLEACEAWMKVESEMGDNNPCPDLALRANYRKEAIKLTEAAIAKAKQ